MKKIIALTLALLMAITCFAACGAQPAAEPGADATAEKEIIVVGYTIYEPMNYTDENGNLVGFDTELATIVFENLGYEVMFQEIVWESKYTDLDSGAIDCIWNGFTANTADNDGILRSEKVDFSYNYMENRQVIVVKADSGIATAADLSGKIGAAEAGSAGAAYGAEFEGATITEMPNQVDCLMEVNAGTADFAIVDAQLAKSYCGQGDYAALQIVEELSSDVEYYAIGFAKGSELTALVNTELEKLAADGTLMELAEKYGVATTVVTDFSDQK